MGKRRLPPASQKCIADAEIVLKKYPLAEAYLERKTAVVHVNDGETEIGMGKSAEAAWADARRNVERPPIFAGVQPGSPTWSLQSDEQYWKRDAPHKSR